MVQSRVESHWSSLRVNNSGQIGSILVRPDLTRSAPNPNFRVQVSFALNSDCQQFKINMYQFFLAIFSSFFTNSRNGLLARGSWILFCQIECGTRYFVGRIWRSQRSSGWRLFCSHFRLNWKVAYSQKVFSIWYHPERKKYPKSLFFNFSPYCYLRNI